MAKFIAIHPVDPPVPFPSEGFTGLAKKCKAGLNLDAYWVCSWLQLNDKGEVTKVYCEWDGKDAKSVQKSLDATMPELPPSGGIFRMVEILGESYR
jgi:hypothetical protein